MIKQEKCKLCNNKITTLAIRTFFLLLRKHLILLHESCILLKITIDFLWKHPSVLWTNLKNNFGLIVRRRNYKGISDDSMAVFEWHPREYLGSECIKLNFFGPNDFIWIILYNFTLLIYFSLQFLKLDFVSLQT